MKLRASVAALLCVVAVEVGAREVDLSLSNDTALLKYAAPISYSGFGQTNADVGLMYTESDDFMFLGGIEMMGEAGSHAPGLHFGVGIQGYGVSLDNGADIGSVALGAKGWYVPPEINRLGLVGQFYLGPNVTTFGDADRFWHFNARAEYEVLPEAAIYVGYRKVRARLELPIAGVRDVDLDKGWHIGLRMSF